MVGHIAEFFTYLFVGGFIAVIAVYGLIIVLPLILGALLYPVVWLMTVFLNVKRN